jgi:hypothetical protein
MESSAAAGDQKNKYPLRETAFPRPNRAGIELLTLNNLVFIQRAESPAFLSAIETRRPQTNSCACFAGAGGGAPP